MIENVANHLTLEAALCDDDQKVQFTATLRGFDDMVPGQSYRIWLGNVTVMSIRIPEGPIRDTLQFGPTYLAFLDCLRLTDLTLRLTLEGKPYGTGVAITSVHGDFGEALSISTEDAFFEKVQLHHSRFKSKALLAIGAKSSFYKFDNFSVKAAALTILSHRILEKDFTTLSDFDLGQIDWILSEATPIAEAKSQELAESSKPAWFEIRWTVSLATVGTNLALLRNDLKIARQLSHIAEKNCHLVAISKVSALNLVYGCFVYGVLSFLAGDRAEALRALEKGVSSYPEMVAAQDMLKNVWVIGDLINVALIARQCFIAMYRMGLVESSSEFAIGDTELVDLSQIKMAIGPIVKSGRSPDLAQAIYSHPNIFIWR